MRRTLPVGALLLAACVAARERDRFVVLESADYGCGAVEGGLGCGVALDPLLRQIDALDGVAESRVSWDGRRFLIRLRPNADEDRVAAAAASVMEGEAARVSAEAEAADIASYFRGERWLDRHRTVELSRDEARQVAAAYGGDIAREVGLDEDAARRLETVMREELVQAFERAHAEGGGVKRLWNRWPDAHRRFENRLATFLTYEQCSRISAILKRELEE